MIGMGSGWRIFGITASIMGRGLESVAEANIVKVGNRGGGVCLGIRERGRGSGFNVKKCVLMVGAHIYLA